MKIHREICLEKKLGKYLFKKDITISKRNKSKSPSSTTEDKENSNLKKKLDILDDDDDLFFDKLLESKLKIVENPFLSNIKKNQHITMKYHEEKTGDTFMKLRSKIIIKDNLSEFIDNNFEISESNLNLFNDAFINSDLLINDEILTSELKDDTINNAKIDKEIKNNNLINSTGELTDKEKIVIEALNSLDKDNMDNNNKNFVLINIEDFDAEKNYFEEIFELKYNKDSEEKIFGYEQKKVIFEAVDKRIKSYYDYYKKNKSYKLDETETEINKFQKKIKYILNMESLHETFYFFCFKSIVYSLYLLIIRWLSKCHFKLYLQSKNEEKIYLDIFIELMEKYNTIKDICPFLEKDFKQIIDNYKQKKDIQFCLCELLTDLYWDYVFKIHKINNMFTSCYKMDNIKKNVIFEEAKHAMKSIIDILIVNDTPYKKNIGIQLNLPYIKNENIFLMSYINKSKKNVNPFEIKNPFVETKEKNTDKETPTDENTNLNETNNSNSQNNKELENTNKEEENKNTDNFTLDEVYNYIVGENKTGNKKNKRKNRKKKKKNKNEETKVVEEIDPIVEEFIQYFFEYNQYNNDYCTKIKPNISEEWLKSIS